MTADKITKIEFPLSGRMKVELYFCGFGDPNKSEIALLKKLLDLHALSMEAEYIPDTVRITKLPLIGGRATWVEYSQEDMETMRKMFLEGKNNKEIAAAIGRSFGSVSMKMIKMGLRQSEREKEKT